MKSEVKFVDTATGKVKTKETSIIVEHFSIEKLNEMAKSKITKRDKYFADEDKK
jgi:hypothetical protein